MKSFFSDTRSFSLLSMVTMWALATFTAIAATTFIDTGGARVYIVGIVSWFGILSGLHFASRNDTCSLKSLWRVIAALMLAIGLIAGAVSMAGAQEMATPVPPFDPGWIREFANLLAQIVARIIQEILSGLGQ